MPLIKANIAMSGIYDPSVWSSVIGCCRDFGNLCPGVTRAENFFFFSLSLSLFYSCKKSLKTLFNNVKFFCFIKSNAHICIKWYKNSCLITNPDCLIIFFFAVVSLFSFIILSFSLVVIIYSGKGLARLLISCAITFYNFIHIKLLLFYDILSLLKEDHRFYLFF